MTNTPKGGEISKRRDKLRHSDLLVIYLSGNRCVRCKHRSSAACRHLGLLPYELILPLFSVTTQHCFSPDRQRWPMQGFPRRPIHTKYLQDKTQVSQQARADGCLSSRHAFGHGHPTDAETMASSSPNWPRIVDTPFPIALLPTSSSSTSTSKTLSSASICSTMEL